MRKNEETEGEDLIADFLEDLGIEFKRYYKLKKLDKDDKSFREADFYLPDIKVCIEFLGLWNNPKNRAKYKQKMAVYHKNKIPCVYLWPNNLGNLDWMLRRRIRVALLKYKKYFHLIKYEFQNFLGEFGSAIIVVGILIHFVKDESWKIGLSLFLIYYIVASLWKYVKRLIKLSKTRYVTRD
ncbi:hypothetical protein JW930_04055 [Candidatus Woesearchaeota archaeon]|nr:hypothetical protein [Candidatus Woesearchaeota archaeon]